VGERGVGALSLREVARHAGVTQAAPYRHFKNKAALIAAVAEEGFRALQAAVEAALARSAAGPVARLHAIGVAYVRFARRHPAHFRVMFGREVAASHGFRSLWDAGQESFATLLREIGAGQKAGVLHGTNPRRAALATWSTVHGLAALLIEGLLARQGFGPGPRRGVEALVRETLGALVDGLKTTAAGRR
jgi:AcrR family transcriptional regulator